MLQSFSVLVARRNIMSIGTECGKNTTQEDFEKFEYPPGPYVAVTGSPLNGFQLYGPFDTVDQAVEWAESKAPMLGPCTVMPLEKAEA
jgi:hypothetical protein